MAHRELVRWTAVEDCDRSFGHPLGQIFAANRFGGVSAIRQAAQDTLDPCEIAFRHQADQVHQGQRPCIAQPVDNGLSITATGHQTGAAQRLKMLRGIGDGEAGLVGQCLHTPLPLRDLFQQHQPCRRRKCTSDQRVFLQQCGLGAD